MNLIFDFDGVIGDTWDAVAHSLVMSKREKNLEGALENIKSYSLKRPHHANGHSLSEKELLEEYKWVSTFGNLVNEHGFNLFAKFVEQIEQIRTINKAIVSSGSLNYVLPAISKTRINPTHILAFEDHHSKEEKVLRVCKDWGIDMNNVYYFTDTLADVFELRKIIDKEKLIGVSWGYCSKEQLLTELSPEMILDDADDLPKLLKV